MAATTKDRSTPSRDALRRSVPVKGATKINAGAMVAINASNLAIPAAATPATLATIGRAEQNVDNSAGADGDQSVEVGAGCFQYGNSAAGDLIAKKDIGKPCYVIDDQTVALTDNSGARPAAGLIFDVDANGVWVRFGT